MRHYPVVALCICALVPLAGNANGVELSAVVEHVTNVTKALPNHFDSDRPVISLEDLGKPLPFDVLSYARFYWTVDFIEGNCEYLGQRSNIEMLDPDTGASSWVAAAAREGHPDYGEYIAIFELFDAAYEDLGEANFCATMYELLGPNGSLMPEAIRINDLIDSTLIDKYRVRIEDGVLWSSRDYCERRYYLEVPGNEDAHRLACEQAKLQGF